MWFSDLELNSQPLHLDGRVLTPGPPGQSLHSACWPLFSCLLLNSWLLLGLLGQIILLSCGHSSSVVLGPPFLFFFVLFPRWFLQHPHLSCHLDATRWFTPDDSCLFYSFIFILLWMPRSLITLPHWQLVLNSTCPNWILFLKNLFLWPSFWLGHLFAKNKTDISPKKTYRWLTNTWKDAKHHSLSEKCKSKPPWGIISHQSEWLLTKSL